MMKTKQTIAVIGADGKMGSAISRNLSEANYRLLLCSTNEPKTLELASEIRLANPDADIEAIFCKEQASWEADVIILAVPYASEKTLAEEIHALANQKIVISFANPLDETYDGFVSGSETSAAEELQKILPNSKVIKAFNTSFATDFTTPIIGRKYSDAFIAGNNKEALETVKELVSAAGFNPIVAGKLRVSRTLENMHLLLIKMGIKYDYYQN